MTAASEHPGSNGHAAPVAVTRDAWGRLVYTDPSGASNVGVEPVRAFPVSDPGRWVSLCDGHGKEVARIASLDGLPAETRALLEEELALREFVPEVRRILRAEGDQFPSEWLVLTDRGETLLRLEHEDDLRAVGPHRVFLTDRRKLRFRIADTRALDAASRRILDRYLS